jgi:hypothetical protein
MKLHELRIDLGKTVSTEEGQFIDNPRGQQACFHHDDPMVIRRSFRPLPTSDGSRPQNRLGILDAEITRPVPGTQ